MRLCRTCLLPDTRPGLTFGPDGVCSACVGHRDKRETVDWAARRRAFGRLVAAAKARRKAYDCIVPVSGGKDSMWQVVRCREHGLRVLAVSWRTPARTPIGQKNLDNLVRLGVDHIDYTINPEVERRFMRKTLERVGDTAVPMHMAIFTIPLRLAVRLDVPLVVWGESPHMEYGGRARDRRRDALDRAWLKRHGILHGTTAEDWVGGGLTRRDLEPYRLPPDAEFRARRIRSVFLGYYLFWDPRESLRVARAHGFQVRREGPKVGYYDYADIDCDFISVHHYFKWLKFGFTRLFDNLSLEIRNGRMTRGAALRIARRTGDQRPDGDIRKLCAFLGMSERRFRAVEDRFRNRALWRREGGVWKIGDFPIPGWRWR